MTILEILKKENISIHNYSKTLFYLNTTDEWEVIEHETKNKYKVLITTKNEEEAVEVFLKD